jgi:hypothetical protein
MKFSIVSLKAWKGVLLSGALLIVTGSLRAQTSGDIHAGYEKYWKEDIALLQKIQGEKDGHKAALLLNTRKDQMLPQLTQLIKATHDYKKTATAADQKKEDEWVMNNPLYEKDADLQSDMMNHAGAKGDEFSKAVGEYMKASMAAIRKAKQ